MIPDKMLYPADPQPHKMIPEIMLNLSEAQEITGTAPSDNFINLRNLGDHLPDLALFLRARVRNAFDGGHSLTVSVENDDHYSFRSPTTLFTGLQVPTADLTPDARLLHIGLPVDLKRYLRLKYLANGVFTNGSVDAWLFSCLRIKGEFE